MGIGIEKDIEKAKEYYLRSAEMGYPRAMMSYGKLIEDENMSLAMDYLRPVSYTHLDVYKRQINART